MTPNEALAFVVKTHGIFITNTRCRVDGLSVMAKSLTLGNLYAKSIFGRIFVILSTHCINFFEHISVTTTDLSCVDT